MTADPSAPPAQRWRGLFTVPSLLSGFRLLASPGLVWLAWANEPKWCLLLFIVLLLSDWLDGKLAIALKQTTTTGARLDSIADAVFYGCVLISMGLLKSAIFRDEFAWIAAAVGSYALSVALGVIKFRRWPSYHTWLAKSSWLLISIAIISIILDYSVWPLRLATAAVFLTNVEAIAITLVLRERRVNVPTVWHAVCRKWKERIKS